LRNPRITLTDGTFYLWLVSHPSEMWIWCRGASCAGPWQCAQT